MSQLAPYAGAERPELDPVPPPDEATAPTWQIERLEAENARLRAAVKSLEGALRCVGRVVAPYARAER